MAVYKVIQDIEAEDKLLGPLTLKGFIYAITAGFLAFLCVKIGISSIDIKYRLIGIFVLLWPMLLFGVLASPLGREQPTEVWLLSHIRFLFKPKARIWSQLGQANLVTITAPKKVDLHLTNDLSQPEVHSRLETLALTMDSRGWAVKNAYPNSASASPPPFAYLNAGQSTSDRLVKRSYPGNSPIADVHPSEDVLDLENSPRAQHVENLLQQKTVELKEKRMSELDTITRGKEPPNSASVSQELTKAIPPAITATKKPDEKPQLTAKLQSLAKNANDMTVASVSALANHVGEPRITMIAPGEVEIKLH